MAKAASSDGPRLISSIGIPTLSVYDCRVDEEGSGLGDILDRIPRHDDD